MSTLLSRFSLDAVKMNGTIMFCMIVIWLAVLGCGISSVRSRPLNRSQRLFWILWIVCLPGIGILTYLPFSMQPLGPTVSFSKKEKKKRGK